MQILRIRIRNTGGTVVGVHSSTVIMLGRWEGGEAQVTVPRARSRRLQRALPVVQSASPAGAARIPGMRKEDVIESTGAHSHWLSESI
jgi:hypothetical protein